MKINNNKDVIEYMYLQVSKKAVITMRPFIKVLKEYSEKCSHVTEFGTRRFTSTYGLLGGFPKKMISYDILDPSYFGNDAIRRYDEIKYLTKGIIDWNFVKADVLSIEIEETDLLFIDTFHTYLQLYSELKKHSPKVKKYIILHDTVAFGDKDEVRGGDYKNHISNHIKGVKSKKEGLNNAINDFLDEDNSFKVEKVFSESAGLTILRRK